MAGFPLGMIVLVVVSLLIYFGLAQRALDRMQLSDRAALAVVAGMALGGFVNVPLSTGAVDVSLNVGGALIPVGLAVYVLSRAGTAWERWRGVLAAAGTAVVVFLVNRFVFSSDPWQTGTDLLDPIYVYPLVGGVTAYLISRSRRSAFIAAVLGVLALDFYDLAYLLFTGTPGRVAIGGAGAFDVIVLAGVVAVLLAELVGESRERLQGGPAGEGRAPELLRNLRALPGAGGVRKPLRETSARKEGGEDRA
ncbi:MAG: DUF1614 domain-containing protein [Armatimonadota bacterium]|nr:DUF1614 domain-containing protein [Armatimonadota bacterium]